MHTRYARKDAKQKSLALSNAQSSTCSVHRAAVEAWNNGVDTKDIDHTLVNMNWVGCDTVSSINGNQLTNFAADFVQCHNCYRFSE